MRAQRYMDTPGNNGFESYSGMVPHKLGRWCKADDVNVLEDRIRALEEAVRVLGAGVFAMKSYLQSDPSPTRPGIGDIIDALDAINDNPIAAEACKETA